MNALVFTKEQNDALIAANGDREIALKPRQLKDGRLILSADLLQDEYFNAPDSPWAPTLAAAEQITITDADLAEPN